MKRTTPRLKSPPEGTWFAVPLRTQGYGVGVVARTNRKGGVIGYFFGKVYREPPLLEEVRGWTADTAVMVMQLGDLGLIDGSWPIIGTDPLWQRTEWPMPDFIRKHSIQPLAWRVKYSDTDLDARLSETRIDYTTAEDPVKLPSDGLYGAGAAERHLTERLDSRYADLLAESREKTRLAKLNNTYSREMYDKIEEEKEAKLEKLKKGR